MMGERRELRLKPGWSPPPKVYRRRWKAALIALVVYAVGGFVAFGTLFPGKLGVCLTYAAVVLVALEVSWWERRLQNGVNTENHPICWRCGYDLHGLTQNSKCPECSFEIDVSIRLWKHWRPFMWWLYRFMGWLFCGKRRISST